MFEAYPPCRQTVTHVLNQKHFLCLEPGPRDRDFDFQPGLQTTLTPIVHKQQGPDVLGYRWQRHDLEACLLNPELAHEVFGVPINETCAAIEDAAKNLKDYEAARWTLGALRASLRKHVIRYTRPTGLAEYGVPIDLSHASVKTWLNTTTLNALVGQQSILKATEVEREFETFQLKLDHLSWSQALMWFSGKDLLAAMTSWRQSLRPVCNQPADYCEAVCRWIERGNASRLAEFAPEFDELRRLCN